MSAIEALRDGAIADTDVLRSLDSNGDRFSVFRVVDFLLRAPDAEKAALVAAFINDHSYGRAQVQDDLSILVVIAMPVEQPITLCVSGFFTCIARLFGVEYDGWGCVAQPQV